MRYLLGLCGTIVLQLLLISTVFAQRTKIDSLHHELRTHPVDDSLKVEILADLAYRYYQSQPDSTLFFAQKALELAQKLNYKQGEGRSLNRLAIAYTVKGNHAQGLEFYLKSLKIAEKLKDEKGIASALNNIGYVLRLQKRFKESINYTNQALSISQRNQNTAAMAVNLSNLGWLYESLGELDKALGFTLRAVKMSDAVQDNYHASISRHIAGKVYFRQKKYDLAEGHYADALKNAEKAQIKQQIAFNHLGLGEVFLVKKLFAEAQPHLEMALKIAQEIKTPEIIQNASVALVSLHRSKKEYEKALAYYEIYDSAKDSVFDINQEIQINRLQYEFETEKNKKEIAYLEKENELKEAKKKLYQDALYVAIGVVFVVVILALKLFQSRQKQWQANRLLAFQKLDLEKKNEAIKAQNEAISSQSFQIQEANKLKDRLFSIIAHDLRNPVIALRNSIDILDPDILQKEELVFIKEELSKQFSSMDFTLTNLLEWARSQMANNQLDKNNIDIYPFIDQKIKSFSLNVCLKEITIENQVSQDLKAHADASHVKFIIRNLISNAIKFTDEGGRVEISANQQKDYICIAVKDTGVGIAPSQKDKLFEIVSNFSTEGTSGEKGTGLGLILCREFVEKNGGIIWVESEVGKGSTFYFTLPV